ncbi:hypothetical protein A3Q56_06738 [Intoshia linei]|uniref:SET domain-containing protein n=1 Tax=Intoshia linei TaxID=1819745 RepID=A0A177AU78_9BILA|nr:hypothetical protein A3Q56_06738 [Intoshia linei]
MGTMIELYGKCSCLTILISLSNLNHECKPNAVCIFDGQNINLFASRNIDIGEEITMSYDLTTAYNDKYKKVLECQYYFKCSCSFCTDYHYPNLCTITKCDCDGPVISNSDTGMICCQKCGKINFDKNFITKRINFLNCLHQLYNSKNHRPERKVAVTIVANKDRILVNNFLKNHKQVIHAKNNEIFWLLMEYVDNLEESIFVYYTEKLISELDFYFGLRTGDVGLMNMRLALYYVEKKEFSVAIKYYCKANDGFDFLSIDHSVRKRINEYIGVCRIQNKLHKAGM